MATVDPKPAGGLAAPVSPPADPWHAPWRLAGLGLLVAIWAVPTTIDPAWWGLAGWRAVPPEWRVPLVLLPACLVLAPPRRLRSTEPASPLAVAAGCLLAGVAFWWLRAEVVWANGDVIAKLVARHQVDLKHLLTTTTATVLAHGFDLVRGPSVGMNGPDAVSLTSTLGGVAYLAGAWALGRVAFPSSPVRGRAVALLLASAGVLQHFCGVVETYPLSLPAQLWALVALVAAYRDGERRPRPRLLLATSASTAVFVATVYLWPASVLACLRRGSLGALPVQVGALALPLLAAALGFLAFGENFERLAGSMGGADDNFWVPLSDDGAGTTHFTMVSWEHAYHRLQALLLGFPAVCLLLPALATARERRLAPPRRELHALLFLTGLGGLAYAVLVNPDQGPHTEWMQTTVGYLPLFVALTLLFADRADERRVRDVSLAGAAVSLAHTLPWILTNAGVLGR